MTTALAIVGPWMLLVRAATGEWAVSGKEIAIVARRWDIEDASLLAVILRHPGAVLGDHPTHLRRQLGYAASVLLLPLVPLLAIGLGVPLAASARRARRVAVLTVVVFMLAVAMINPGKRYVTPLLPLVLPWIAAGALALGDRLRGAGPAAAAWTRGAAIAGIAALAVHAAVPTARRWKDCFRRVCEWLETRYGRPLPPVMARDGRIAYLCDTPYVHQPRRRSITEIAPDVAESGAVAWLVKARRLPSTTLTGVRRVAILCEGATHEYRRRSGVFREMDHVGPHGRDVRVVEPERRRDAAPVVLDHDVGRRAEPEREPPSFTGTEVEADALRAAILVVEGEGAVRRVGIERHLA